MEVASPKPAGGEAAEHHPLVSAKPRDRLSIDFRDGFPSHGDTVAIWRHCCQPVAIEVFGQATRYVAAVAGWGVFVREFAQPLPPQQAAEQPIKARLHVLVWARPEFLLAPVRAQLTEPRRSQEDLRTTANGRAACGNERFYPVNYSRRTGWGSFQATVMKQKVQ